MSDELSDEMRTQIANFLREDLHAMSGILQRYYPHNKIPYDQLEHLAYMTEQIRLKLKLLGAPRLYN